jgi:hypothetical protein
MVSSGKNAPDLLNHVQKVRDLDRSSGMIRYGETV